MSSTDYRPSPYAPRHSSRLNRLGMILKGYPRISENFISSEILLLESLGMPVEIYSLKQPRETFTHGNIQSMQAPVFYMPEYILPHWKVLFKSNFEAWRKLGPVYAERLREAALRALERRSSATLRHFLQAGHLTVERLMDHTISHIHAHFCHTPTSVALFAAQLTGLPYSFTAHAKDIYTSEPEQLARKIRKARFVVTCTRYNARYLSQLSCRSPRGENTPIHTIYHGIDLNFFNFGQRPTCGPPYTILSIGRHVSKKGYDDLFQAIKILDEAGLDFRLVQIGSGELTAELMAMISALRLQHRVKMLGTLPHEEVIEHYRLAHCFALSCKVAANGDRDGIPNVLAEAMAVGVPVIATRVSAIPELVEDGVTGTLVEAQEPAAMARAIMNVLIHREKFADQVRRARKRVESDFDQRRCVAELFELFQKNLTIT
jgi:glycosyltransferase involved in cell wall biosynthesis